jgi:hypothetical protein
MADPGQLLTVAEIAPELKMNQQTIPNWVGEVGRLTAMPTTLKLGACARASATTGTVRPEGWRVCAIFERKTNRGRLAARS